MLIKKRTKLGYVCSFVFIIKIILSNRFSMNYLLNVIAYNFYVSQIFFKRVEYGMEHNIGYIHNLNDDVQFRALNFHKTSFLISYKS